MAALTGPRGYTQFGYRAARISRESLGPRATGGSGDRHLRTDRHELANQADQLYRDNGIYKGIVDRFVDAVYGTTGFTLDPNYGSKKLNAKVAARWKLFCLKPEARGLFSWREMERLVLLAVVNHGDHGGIHTNKKKFQLTEAEELGGPVALTRVSGLGAKKGERWEGGVLLDEVGAPKAYRIHGRNRHGIVTAGKGQRIEKELFTHLAHRDRSSQTRGVPVLTSVFSMAHRINDVCDSEAIGWQILSKLALMVTREGGPEQAYTESKEDADGVSAPPDWADRVSEVEEATIFHGKPGEAITSIDRNLPGKDFPESVRMFLRLIGLPLGMPLEVILLDYSKTNYSSARAALEQAYRTYICWQTFLMDGWHSPLYRQWLRWEIEDGSLPRSKQLVADSLGEVEPLHKWEAPKFPWIDQLKEAQAWGERLDRGLATQTQALASIGMGHEEWLAKRSAEIELAIQEAEKLNKKHPKAEVDWRTLAGIPTSKTQGVSSKSTGGGEQQDSEAEETEKPSKNNKTQPSKEDPSE